MGSSCVLESWRQGWEQEVNSHCYGIGTKFKYAGIATAKEEDFKGTIPKWLRFDSEGRALKYCPRELTALATNEDFYVFAYTRPVPTETTKDYSYYHIVGIEFNIPENEKENYPKPPKFDMKWGYLKVGNQKSNCNNKVIIVKELPATTST